MGTFTNFLGKKQQPMYQDGFLQIVENQQQQQPIVDSSNAIGSLAQILGPTPAEREAQLNKLERGRQQMAMWTGLFDGLRQLGNLYYTSKGARPQHYNDPYTEVDKTYARNKQTLDDLTAYNRQYAQQLYALQRQAGEDQRKDLLAQAQADYYNSREEVARQKAENDRLTALLRGKQVMKMQDGSLILVDKEAGTAEQIRESDPLYGQLMQSKINKNNRTGTGGGRSGGSNSTYGYKTTTYYDEQGRKITERVPTTPNQPAGKEQPTKKVAQPKKPANNRKQGNSTTPTNKGKKKVDW